MPAGRVSRITTGIPADEEVASAYARLASRALARARKPGVHDTWVPRPRSLHGAQVWTQDAAPPST